MSWEVLLSLWKQFYTMVCDSKGTLSINLSDVITAYYGSGVEIKNLNWVRSGNLKNVSIFHVQGVWQTPRSSYLMGNVEIIIERAWLISWCNCPMVWFIWADEKAVYWTSGADTDCLKRRVSLHTAFSPAQINHTEQAVKSCNFCRSKVQSYTLLM